MPLAGMQNEKTIVNLVELTSRAHSRWSCRSIADATPSLVRTLKIYEDRIQWHGSPRFILCQWWDALCSDQVSCLDAWDSVLLQILCRVKEISLHRLKVLIVRLALDIQLVSCQANRSTVQNPHWGWVFAANTLSSTLTRPCHKQSIDYTHMHQVKIESDIFFHIYSLSKLVGVASWFTAAQATQVGDLEKVCVPHCDREHCRLSEEWGIITIFNIRSKKAMLGFQTLKWHVWTLSARQRVLHEA